MKIIIILCFSLIFLSLGFALFYMLKGSGNSRKMLLSLKFRVGLSIILIIFILLSYSMGWINVSGIKIPS